MNSIQPVTDRNWDHDKFAGDLRNKNNESDIGVNFQLYEEEVEKRSKEADCARVLQHGSLGLLSDEEIRHLDATLALLYLQPQDLNTLRQVTMVRKELRENIILKNSINSSAAKVLTIRKSISLPNVHQSINAIVGLLYEDDLRALRTVRTKHGEIYFGEAFDRKDTFIQRMNEIGIAKTLPDLLMLLGQLDHIFVKTKESLTWKDMYGVEQLYDISVRPFGEAEKIRYLQQRISSSMPVLSNPRKTVQEALRNGNTFDALHQRLTEDLREDRPSLDNDQSLKRSFSFAATTDYTHSLTEEQKKFYYEAGKRDHDVPSRSNSSSLPSYVPPLPNVPSRSNSSSLSPYVPVPPFAPYASAPQKCNHWNGEVCDFQVKTGNTCKYASSHTPLVSSFTHSFTPRPPTSIVISSEENELFKRFKREQASNNSSSH
jgi:hypothetical protein